MSEAKPQLPYLEKVDQRDRLAIWVVDGSFVRAQLNEEFTNYGQHYAFPFIPYEFVPENEVWIDNDLEQKERPYVLLHELHERNLMAKGWTYDRAHADSSKVEYHSRHHPDEQHEALAIEGWE